MDTGGARNESDDLAMIGKRTLPPPESPPQRADDADTKYKEVPIAATKM